MIGLTTKFSIDAKVIMVFPVLRSLTELEVSTNDYPRTSCVPHVTVNKEILFNPKRKKLSKKYTKSSIDSIAA